MKIIIYTLAIFALFNTSCTERIELELNSDEHVRLVVEGWITNQQKAHSVKLTTTTSYFENESAPKVSGAVVSITDGANTYALAENEPGMYYTDPSVSGSIGSTYTLNVDWNDESFSASAYLDTVSAIDSVGYEYWEDLEDPMYNGYDLFLFTQELPGVGDFYMWRVLINGVSVRDTLNQIVFVEDDFVDGNYIGGWNFEYIDAEVGDNVTVEQLSIEAEANAIFLGIMLETEWRGGPFDTPPANVPSNISNGALGYFGAAGVSAYSFVIEP
jgi:hypothetical protein